MAMTVAGSTGITYPDTTTQTSGFTQSLATSGYQKLPSGLKLAWGEVVVGDPGSDYFGTFTYPTTFTTVYQAMVTMYSYNAGAFDCSSAITSVGLSSCGFTVQEWAGGAQNITAKFLIIGV